MAILNDTQINGNLNVTEDIQIAGNPMGDYVVESGSSGTWRYRKWSNGEVELRARTSVTCEVKTASGNMYKSAIQSISLPFTVYDAAPVVTCTDHNTLASGSNISTATTSIGVVIWRSGIYQSFTWGLSVIVMGRWKE